MAKKFHVYEDYSTDELMSALEYAIWDYKENNHYLKINIVMEEIRERLKRHEEIRQMENYRITYIMYPEKDIEVTYAAKSYEDAVIFAKNYRRDSFKIEKIQNQGEQA